MKQGEECEFSREKEDYFDLRHDGLGIGADISLPQEGEQFGSVVICHEVPRQRINHDSNVRMAARRTRMLGNGCQEPVLIDGCLLQMPMDKEKIMGGVNVLKRELADVEMALPYAERYGVTPSTSDEIPGCADEDC
jgi:hypothetical protein